MGGLCADEQTFHGTTLTLRASGCATSIAFMEALRKAHRLLVCTWVISNISLTWLPWTVES
jgi:hypothetical protein